MEEIRDVLVFTPIYRLEPETVQAIFAMEWNGAISYLFQKDNPYKPTGMGGRKNHLHQYERGQEVFLAGRYDAMLVIESDIIPPVDALKKLAALDADIAYGVYRFRVSNVVNIFERYAPEARNIGESLSIHPHKLYRAIQRGVTPCSGAGLGCVLIKRQVLEEVKFRRVDSMSPHCDTWFTSDAYHAGYEMMADMSVICGHKNEFGEVLWPEYPVLN